MANTTPDRSNRQHGSTDGHPQQNELETETFESSVRPRRPPRETLNTPDTETYEATPMPLEPRSPDQSFLQKTLRHLQLQQHKLRRLKVRHLYYQALNRFGIPGVGHVLVGSIAVTAGVVTVNNPDIVRLWERQIQTIFFDVRGPIAPPAYNGATSDPNKTGVVIAAMDTETMKQGEFYAASPKDYGEFAPIERWPWQRRAYAIAIERLLQAGAKSVAVDVVFDTPSVYGPEDDAALQQVLTKYPGRVVLAAQYVESNDRTGDRIEILTPNQQLTSANPTLGFINLPLGPDNRIHQLGFEYARALKATYGDQLPETQSFAQATVKSAQIEVPPLTGTNIFFYGPSQTFQHVSFWSILDSTYWQEYHLANQTFKNKIVLIGPTDPLFQDFHAAPFSSSLLHPVKMSGVEVQANAIATLLEQKLIRYAFNNLWLAGGAVIAVVGSAGYLQSRAIRPSRRLAAALAIAASWGLISYTVFVRGQMILPTTIPILAISLSGVTYLCTGFVSDRLGLRQVVKRYASAPLMQEFLSDLVSQQGHHSDLRPLLEENHRQLTDQILDGRYRILKELAAGGFGATYIAEDQKRPGQPKCVVKRLSPRSNNPKVIQYARARFPREAATLEKLGKHPQIPQLLAYFEENEEFYLVLEYVEGKSLEEELRLNNYLAQPLPERLVVAMLVDLLSILDFVHSQGVIHRDVKPSNIMRRQSDAQLVLIDFGAVKEFNHLEADEELSQFTVAIGTDGFMAPEQAIGKPRPSSDIYAAGIIGIQALTGISATELKNRRNGPSTALQWQESAQVSQTLADILDRMVEYDYAKRYHTAKAVLAELKPLLEKNQLATGQGGGTATIAIADSTTDVDAVPDADTKLWQDVLDLSPELPPTAQAPVDDLEATALPPTDMAPLPPPKPTQPLAPVKPLSDLDATALPPIDEVPKPPAKRRSR